MHFDHSWKTGGQLTGRRVTGLAAWGNPLARPSDKYLPVASAVLLFIWIMLVPFLLAHVFVAVADAGRAAAAEATQLVTTQATLLRATQPRYDSRGLVLAGEVPVEASWVSSTGAVLQGRISAPPGLSEGATVPVWVTAGGSLHKPPRTSTWARDELVVSAIAGWTAVGVILWGCDSTLKCAVRRRNIRRWASEWSTLGGSFD